MAHIPGHAFSGFTPSHWRDLGGIHPGDYESNLPYRYEELIEGGLIPWYQQMGLWRNLPSSNYLHQRDNPLVAQYFSPTIPGFTGPAREIAPHITELMPYDPFGGTWNQSPHWLPSDSYQVQNPTHITPSISGMGNRSRYFTSKRSEDWAARSPELLGPYDLNPNIEFNRFIPMDRGPWDDGTVIRNEEGKPTGILPDPIYPVSNVIPEVGTMDIDPDTAMTLADLVPSSNLGVAKMDAMPSTMPWDTVPTRSRDISPAPVVSPISPEDYTTAGFGMDDLEATIEQSLKDPGKPGGQEIDKATIDTEDDASNFLKYNFNLAPEENKDGLTLADQTLKAAGYLTREEQAAIAEEKKPRGEFTGQFQNIDDGETYTEFIRRKGTTREGGESDAAYRERRRDRLARSLGLPEGIGKVTDPNVVGADPDKLPPQMPDWATKGLPDIGYQGYESLSPRDQKRIDDLMDQARITGASPEEKPITGYESVVRLAKSVGVDVDALDQEDVKKLGLFETLSKDLERQFESQGATSEAAKKMADKETAKQKRKVDAVSKRTGSSRAEPRPADDPLRDLRWPEIQMGYLRGELDPATVRRSLFSIERSDDLEKMGLNWEGTLELWDVLSRRQYLNDEGRLITSGTPIREAFDPAGALAAWRGGGGFPGMPDKSYVADPEVVPTPEVTRVSSRPPAIPVYNTVDDLARELESQVGSDGRRYTPEEALRLATVQWNRMNTPPEEYDRSTAQIYETYFDPTTGEPGRRLVTVDRPAATGEQQFFTATDPTPEDVVPAPSLDLAPPGSYWEGNLRFPEETSELGQVWDSGDYVAGANRFDPVTGEWIPGAGWAAPVGSLEDGRPSIVDQYPRSVADDIALRQGNQSNYGIAQPGQGDGTSVIPGDGTTDWLSDSAGAAFLGLDPQLWKDREDLFTRRADMVSNAFARLNLRDAYSGRFYDYLQERLPTQGIYAALKTIPDIAGDVAGVYNPVAFDYLGLSKPGTPGGTTELSADPYEAFRQSKFYGAMPTKQDYRDAWGTALQAQYQPYWEGRGYTATDGLPWEDVSDRLKKLQQNEVYDIARSYAGLGATPRTAYSQGQRITEDLQRWYADPKNLWEDPYEALGSWDPTKGQITGGAFGGFQ